MKSKDTLILFCSISLLVSCSLMPTRENRCLQTCKTMLEAIKSGDSSKIFSLYYHFDKSNPGGDPWNLKYAGEILKNHPIPDDDSISVVNVMKQITILFPFGKTEYKDSRFNKIYIEFVFIEGLPSNKVSFMEANPGAKVINIPDSLDPLNVILK